MGCIAPGPIFASKYYLREAGVFTPENQLVYLGGQIFLWLEWTYFALITIALWNAAHNHIVRAKSGGPEKSIWGIIAKWLAVASGMLALGSFANLSGLTTLLLGKPLFIGLGGG